jgi:hypothetical protein
MSLDDLRDLDQRQLLVLVVGELRAMRRLIGAVFLFAVAASVVASTVAAMAR